MIHLFGVSKIYPPDTSALVDAYFDVQQGEFVFLAGASGAGKTTLLKLLVRAEEPTDGQIVVNGRNVERLDGGGIAKLRRQIGVVFHDFKLLPHMTLLENVALAAEVAGVPVRESRAKAFHLLRELGLKEKHNARPPMLSRNEQQRVAIARALANDPLLILADEPTGSLDSDIADETMRLFGRMHERGATIVIATHDVALPKRYPYRAVPLDGGRLLGDSPCAVETAM